jgi:WD40 repeat protein
MMCILVYILGSVDASIKMWNPDDLKDLGELGTHDDTVTKLVSNDGMLFSGGQDAAVSRISSLLSIEKRLEILATPL